MDSLLAHFSEMVSNAKTDRSFPSDFSVHEITNSSIYLDAPSQDVNANKQLDLATSLFLSPSVSKKQQKSFKFRWMHLKLCSSSFALGPSHRVVKPGSDSTLQPKASQRIALRQRQQELALLETWIHENQQQPAIKEYLAAFSAKFVSDSRLKRFLEIPRPGSEDIKLTTELRQSNAVCSKKFDAAKAALVEVWGKEEQSMVERRHDAVKAMVKGVSAKTLPKQTSKQSAIGNYRQRKLDEAEADVHRQVKERWDTLARAATHLAQQDLEASDATYTRQPMGSLFDKDDSDKRVSASAFGLERTKVVPIDAETWTECYDASRGHYYYVSSLGLATWDPPESYVPMSGS